VNTGAAIRWNAPELSGGRVAVTPPAAPAEPERKPGPSVEELAAIEKAARDEGYAAGRAEGLAAGEAEVRRLTTQLGAVLAGFARPLEQLDDEVERVLAALSVQIAGHLLGRAYEADPALLADLVRTALAQAGASARDAEVHLAAADVKLLQEQMVGGESIRLVADPALKRGEIRVHTELLRLDGRIGARIDSALAALRHDPVVEPDSDGDIA